MPELSGSLKGDFDLVVHFSDRTYFSAQVDPIVKKLFQSSLQGCNQIAIGTWQEGIGPFDDTDLGTQVGIDCPHFQTDVSSPDDKHFGWNVTEVQRTG